MAEKKGLSPLAIALIVVGCLVVIGGLALVAAGWFVYNRVQEVAGGSEVWEQNPALAAARVALSMDPDVEVLDADADSGILRIRNRETGEETCRGGCEVGPNPRPGDQQDNVN